MLPSTRIEFLSSVLQKEDLRFLDTCSKGIQMFGTVFPNVRCLLVQHVFNIPNELATSRCHRDPEPTSRWESPLSASSAKAFSHRWKPQKSRNHRIDLPGERTCHWFLVGICCHLLCRFGALDSQKWSKLQAIQNDGRSQWAVSTWNSRMASAEPAMNMPRTLTFFVASCLTCPPIGNCDWILVSTFGHTWACQVPPAIKMFP